jgi:hypothetical protein
MLMFVSWTQKLNLILLPPSLTVRTKESFVIKISQVVVKGEPRTGSCLGAYVVSTQITDLLHGYFLPRVPSLPLSHPENLPAEFSISPSNKDDYTMII